MIKLNNKIEYEWDLKYQDVFFSQNKDFYSKPLLLLPSITSVIGRPQTIPWWVADNLW